MSTSSTTEKNQGHELIVDEANDQDVPTTISTTLLQKEANGTGENPTEQPQTDIDTIAYTQQPAAADTLENLVAETENDLTNETTASEENPEVEAAPSEQTEDGQQRDSKGLQSCVKEDIPPANNEEEPCQTLETSMTGQAEDCEHLDDFTDSKDDNEVKGADDDFDDFGDFNDDFVDATTTADGDDDDFGDFDDFEQAADIVETVEQAEKFEAVEAQPRTPTDAEVYVDVLTNRPDQVQQFITDYLNDLWQSNQGSQQKEDFIEYEEPDAIMDSKQNPLEVDLLTTPSSKELWDKLTRDTVFYNPVTGSAGQFQWTRSETNKAYLHALGVTFINNYDDTPIKSYTSSSTANLSSNTVSASKQRHSNNLEPKRSSTISTSHSSSPNNHQSYSPAHIRSASSSGNLSIVTAKLDESAREAKKEAVQELELDIDIARAYCDLTEETIRVFPDVKLKTMVDELARLQKQAGEYLENLLDQQEQLKMDAETYNDLISCIVGHAQRLHVQNKDASPAMVSKKKKSGSGTFSNLMRRKTTTGNTSQSVSMGGGVVGVKQHHQQQQQAVGPAPTKTMSTASQHPITSNDNRRSM